MYLADKECVVFDIPDTTKDNVWLCPVVRPGQPF